MDDCLLALFHLLEFDVTLSLDKSSVPRHFSLSTCKLSKELGMCLAINRHTLDAAVGVTLIGIEEAVGTSVMI